MRFAPSIAAAALLCTLTAGSAGAQARPPIYPGLGEHTHRVTATPAAQRYFDQGLRLLYAFGRKPSAESFREAARRDPACAMCWWGVGMALGPYINDDEMDSAAVREARTALRRARSLARRATAPERAYIDALAHRYAPGDSGSGPLRKRLDSAYADAMRAVAARYPADADAQVLFAEAVQILRGWEWYGPDRQAVPGTEEFVAALERALQLDPDHPGACHYYIHGVEGSTNPRRAEPCADRLGSLMPGASHIVHMPGHIYLRIGRYADAVRVNQHAHHVDSLAETDGPRRRAPGVYPSHNLDFVRAGAMMSGESEVAIAAGRAMLAADTTDPWGVADLSMALARFGRWSDLLALRMPPVALADSVEQVVFGYVQFAGGLALLRTGDSSGARRALDSLRVIRAAAPDTGYGPSQRMVVAVAEGILAGEFFAAERRLDEAIRELSRAAVIEDSLEYIEPPAWLIPARQFLGTLLLQQGRWADAEAVFREDIVRYPDNGWSLTGLALCLRAQGRSAESEAVAGRLRQVWPRADVQPGASRF